MSSQQECMNVIMSLQHKCMDVILSLPQEHIYEIVAIIPGTQIADNIADIHADILAMNTLAFHDLMTPMIKEIYFDRPSYWAENVAEFCFGESHKVTQPMIRNSWTWEEEPMPVLKVVRNLLCDQFYNKREVLKDVRNFVLSGNLHRNFHQLMTPMIKEIYCGRPFYWAEKAAKFVFHKCHKVNQPMIRNNRTWETQPMPVLEVVAYLLCNQFYNKRVVLKDVRKFLLSGNKLRKLT